MKDNANTPYDDVFRTLLNDCPDLIIPVINDTFGTRFIMGKDKVKKGSNEFFFTGRDGEQKGVISDSHITIGNKQFHIECQSTPDGDMAVRMFAYDVQIAMEHASKQPDRYVVEFPQSAVLYLRSTGNTPNYMTFEIRVPGDSCRYQVPCLKAKNYSAGELFEKQLYFLIPFHIFTYESNFAEYEKDEEKRKELIKHYAALRSQLELLTESERISEYYKQTIVDMSQKVIRNIAKKYNKTRERISDVMGGKILEYEAKTILNQGRAEGRIEGRVEGRAEGRKEVIFSFVEDGIILPQTGAETLHISVEELKIMMEKKGYTFPH